jgi:hypothetical protein
MAAAKQEQQQ